MYKYVLNIQVYIIVVPTTGFIFYSENKYIINFHLSLLPVCIGTSYCKIKKKKKQFFLKRIQIHFKYILQT